MAALPERPHWQLGHVPVSTWMPTLLVSRLPAAFPFRITQYAIRHASGGQGQYPGGDGIVREIEFLGDAQVTMLSDRRKLQPYGLAGGESAKSGENTLVHRNRRRRLPSKFNMRVEAGDRLRIATPGGGGYGAPQA
jgi:N-methylhydantoinase B